jgi:hypothetical protein
MKILEQQLVFQTGPICRVKGTHRISSHEDQDHLSYYAYIHDMVPLIDTTCISTVIHWQTAIQQSFQELRAIQNSSLLVQVAL